MQKNGRNSVEKDKDYRPRKDNRKEKRLMINSTNLKKKKKIIKWTLFENEKFLEFIKANIQLLSNPKRRKQEKVFLQISKNVKTRSPDQCRSHHQKMIKHHVDLIGVIQNLESRLLKNLFENIYTSNLYIGQEIQVLQQEQKQSSIFEKSMVISNIIGNVQDKQIWAVILDEIWINN